jgi:hypothetical protein
MTVQPIENGKWYIDNDTENFWLCENNAWVKKGRLFRANLVGLLSEGPFPFTNGQKFELAVGATPVRYYDAFSTARSEVFCQFPAAADCEIIFTDNLAGFLSTGTDVICRASISPTSQFATLTFNDVTVPAFTPLWLVMPATADVALAGLRAIFAGEPS